MRSLAIVTFATAALALAACNRTDNDRTTRAPGVEPTSAASASATTPTTANMEPFGSRLDPRLAFNDAPPSKMPSSKGGGPADQQAHVEAQWAAAKAPDTASADEAKQQVLEQHAGEKAASGAPAATARDTAANNPRHGTLTRAEESSSLPKAGQVNNHSSPALEADSGHPSK